jgi:type I restriction enzyme S subunit
MIVSSDFHARLEKSRLRPGDVVTVRTGSPGQSAVVPEWLPDANCSDLVIIRPGPELDATWLSYYLNWITSSEIAAHLVGAVQQHFNVRSAESLVLNLPCLTEQRAVAEVLGALDDKISANTGILALLDRLTQSEFTRARQAVVSAPVTFGDIAAIGGGGTPQTAIADYWTGDIAWATPTDVTGLAAPYLDETKRSLTASGLASCSSPLYPAGSILMTSRATIGAFAVAQKPMAVNQGFIVVNAINADHQWWLFHEMRARVDEFLTFANGATFLELPRGRFKALPVLVPDEDVARAFHSTVTPLHKRAGALVEENLRLAATRDELLPLLMSGRITVRGARELAGVGT